MTDRAEAIQKWLQDPDQLQDWEKESLLPKWMDTLQQARSLHPEVIPEAQKRVLDYIVLTDGYSVRRELALLRLAQTNAQLAGIGQVTAQQVDLAAQMIGLPLIKPSLGTVPPEPEKPVQSESTQQADSNIRKAKNEAQSVIEKQEPTPGREPVYAADTAETLLSQLIVIDGALANPYPEDTTPVQREAASLRLPLQRFKNSVSGRGAIIGVEPATIPQDLAIVSTLLEAAKYQQIRRSTLLEQQGVPDALVESGLKISLNEGRSLILQSTDLRRYRRAVVPEQILALVLDYTCLQKCKWQEALLTYLQWAYVERASVCLVQVGALNAQDELRAEKREADNILVPRIQSRLELDQGRATTRVGSGVTNLTPCLAAWANAVQKAVLVVISDGQGNIPLEASRLGKVIPPVGKRGIEDALQVAQQIAALNGVESVVLNPQPKHYTDLPVKLAQALGAKMAKIPSLKAWEVDE